jgi:glyoxylase I family protein
MKILGLDHVVIRCRDVERMIRFYRDILGCSVEKRQDSIGLIHLRAGAHMIDLVSIDGELGRVGGAAPGIDGHNVDHICLRIEPFDIEELREHFSKYGINLGQVHDNYGAEGSGPSVYLTDPEHNTIELKGR